MEPAEPAGEWCRVMENKIMIHSNIRLSLLQMCFRHDHDASQIIAKAKALEAYVSDAYSGDTQPEKRRGRPPKADKAK